MQMTVIRDQVPNYLTGGFYFDPDEALESNMCRALACSLLL